MAGLKLKRALKVSALIRSGINTPSRILSRINDNPEIAYTGKTKAIQLKALERDLQRLQNLGIVFNYDPQKRCYIEKESGSLSGLIHLAEDEMEILKQIPMVFRQTPYEEAAQEFRNKLVQMLPLDQQHKTSENVHVRMSFPALEQLKPYEQTALQIDKAFREQREMTFLYKPPGRKEPYEMRVLVTSELELRDGHFYFELQSLRSEIQRSYRLSRVVPGSVKLHPKRITIPQHHIVPIKLRYWLSSDLEPTPHFPNRFEAKQDETGWIVSAEVDERDIFRVVKILLRYGGNCQVLEPVALVDEMRRTVEEIAKRYALI